MDYEENPMLQNLVKKPKKPNKLITIMGAIILVCLVIILILALRKPEVINTETLRKQSLDDVALELEYFIDVNGLDALDSYGFESVNRVAIDNACNGVYNCTEISGEYVEKFVADIFDKKVIFSNINCELNDGALYTYDANENKYILNKHNHNGMNTKPIYTKVNSIKRKDNKIELVLNKLYYNPLLSNNITSDPLGINVIYDSKDYMHTTEDGEDIDMTKLEANYENNFDELKNTGTRYKYIFSEKNGHYVLEDYDVIEKE